MTARAASMEDGHRRTLGAHGASGLRTLGAVAHLAGADRGLHIRATMRPTGCLRASRHPCRGTVGPRPSRGGPYGDRTGPRPDRVGRAQHSLAGLLLGVGFAASVDEVVFHQLLAWDIVAAAVLAAGLILTVPTQRAARRVDQHP